MQYYIKLYLSFFDLGEQDLLTCEYCGRMGRVDGSNFDLHHIYGRGKDKTRIENICCLCRDCHTDAHNCKISKVELQEIHDKFLNSRILK
jgi:hypothetical protein